MCKGQNGEPRFRSPPFTHVPMPHHTCMIVAPDHPDPMHSSYRFIPLMAKGYCLQFDLN